MLPTLREGNVLVISPWIYFFRSPVINDIVVLYDPKGREVVKRIVKKENGLFSVQGDNKQESTDSRNYGPISRDCIIGKIIYTFS